MAKESIPQRSSANVPATQRLFEPLRIQAEMVIGVDLAAGQARIVIAELNAQASIVNGSKVGRRYLQQAQPAPSSKNNVGQASTVDTHHRARPTE